MVPAPSAATRAPSGVQAQLLQSLADLFSQAMVNVAVQNQPAVALLVIPDASPAQLHVLQLQMEERQRQKQLSQQIAEQRATERSQREREWVEMENERIELQHRQLSLSRPT